VLSLSCATYLLASPGYVPLMQLHWYLRFVAFPATKYDEVLSGYQPGQMVEQWKNQRFKDHLCPIPQGFFLAFSLLNHLAQLIAQENFFIGICQFH
jgi:hypothetical protein